MKDDEIAFVCLLLIVATQIELIKYFRAKEGEPVLLQNPKILEIAKKLKKTPAQIVLRFQVQRDVIVIPKSVTKSRIESNFQVRIKSA